MALTIVCEGCGESVEAKRPTKRFCSSMCRRRSWDSPPAAEPTDSDLVKAVRHELTMARRVDTFEGQLAIVLAQRMHTAPNTAVAALSVELRSTLARAVVGVGVPDEVDQARQRAREKRAAVGLEPK